MRFFLVATVCFACSAARADDPVVVLGGANGFFNSPGIPGDAVNLLKKVGQQPLKCFAFTPGGGDWVFLFGGNGYYTSNVNLPVCKKLTELQKQDANFKCVAFAPGGGWTVLWNTNGNWTQGDVPAGALKKIVDVATRGGVLRAVAYGPRGAWVVLFDKSGVAHGNVPDDLAKILDRAAQKGQAILCVDFIGPDWICLADGDWWTSNRKLAAAARISRQFQQGGQPKWIAVKTPFTAHNVARWMQIYRTALEGKLAGGYAFEILNQGRVVAHGAEGWARAPWEKESPSVKWTIDKPMGVASVSKTITAVAVMKLWEQSGHRFSLDDPFWPHIKAVCPRAHADVKTVTIRQLLTHRSGFKPGDDATDPQKLEKLLNAPLAHKPGTFNEYQNNNYYILHLVIEQIGRVQYTPYVKEHVLIPMGITGMETHFQAAAPTCGYDKPGDKRLGYPFPWQCGTWAGAAGWYASVNDLGRFLVGIREFKALTRETTEEMRKGNFGWDRSDPGWTKGGLWVWDEGQRAGQVGSVISQFPDGFDAVLLVNCKPPVDIEDLVVRAWRESGE